MVSLIFWICWIGIGAYFFWQDFKVTIVENGKSFTFADLACGLTYFFFGPILLAVFIEEKIRTSEIWKKEIIKKRK